MRVLIDMYFEILMHKMILRLGFASKIVSKSRKWVRIHMKYYWQ